MLRVRVGGSAELIVVDNKRNVQRVSPENLRYVNEKVRYFSTDAIYPSSIVLYSTTRYYILYKCSYKRGLLAADPRYISEERPPRAQ